MSLVFQGRVAEAVAPARQAVELAPSRAIPHFVLGMTRLFRGDPLGARESIERALRPNPHPPPQLRTILAVVHLRARHDREAAAVFEEVRRLSPDLILARIALAYLYQRSGREQAAQEMVREALAINPDLDVEAVSQITLSGNYPGFVEALRAAGLR